MHNSPSRGSCHCEERSDEAISLFFEEGDCFAPGACPEHNEGVARNDVLSILNKSCQSCLFPCPCSACSSPRIFSTGMFRRFSIINEELQQSQRLLPGFCVMELEVLLKFEGGQHGQENCDEMERGRRTGIAEQRALDRRRPRAAGPGPLRGRRRRRARAMGFFDIPAGSIRKVPGPRRRPSSRRSWRPARANPPSPP